VFLVSSSLSSLNRSTKPEFAFDPFLTAETGLLDICFFEADKSDLLI